LQTSHCSHDQKAEVAGKDGRGYVLIGHRDAKKSFLTDIEFVTLTVIDFNDIRKTS